MTLELGPDDKRLRLRYAGTCRLCGRPLTEGTDAVYERSSKTVRCIDCATDAAEPGTNGLILALSDDTQSTKAW